MKGAKSVVMNKVDVYFTCIILSLFSILTCILFYQNTMIKRELVKREAEIYMTQYESYLARYILLFESECNEQ